MRWRLGKWQRMAARHPDSLTPSLYKCQSGFVPTADDALPAHLRQRLRLTQKKKTRAAKAIAQTETCNNAVADRNCPTSSSPHLGLPAMQLVRLINGPKHSGDKIDYTTVHSVAFSPLLPWKLLSM